MEKNKFKNGDLVQLKSGGPIMTVKWIEENRICCTWFENDSKPIDHVFQDFQLELYDTADSISIGSV